MSFAFGERANMILFGCKKENVFRILDACDLHDTPKTYLDTTIQTTRNENHKEVTEESNFQITLHD